MLRSDSPGQARWELQRERPALLLWGLMSVQGIIAAGKDPWSGRVAGALRIVREAMRTPRRWRRRGDLRQALTGALQDDCVWTQSKIARDWPHQKHEAPPGVPKIRPGTADESASARAHYGKVG
ncbi:MAG: hypothetical protein IT449_13560 [Phycisphaerales bacterium]|nr:hypothetical protein [Phycisphaerales bacterium]